MLAEISTLMPGSNATVPLLNFFLADTFQVAIIYSVKGYPFMQVKYWSVETLGIFIPYFCSKARNISIGVGFALVVVLIISTQAPAGSLPTCFTALTVQ